MSLLLHPLTLALGWMLLHFLWQGLLAGLATALLLRILRGSSAQVRHLAACAGLVACLVMPTMTLLRVLPANPSSIATPAATPAPHRIPTISPAVPKPQTSLKERLEVVLRPALPWLVGTWVLGSLVFLLRLLGGCLWLQRLRASHSSPAPREWTHRLAALAHQMKVGRCPELRVCEAVDGPLVHGWWRPIVFVPASLVTGLDPVLLEALLAHELAHIQRQDYLANLLQSLCETLLFFHPAVWWISAKIRATREEACDDLAAKAIGEPRRLALALAELDLFQLPAPALGAHQGDLMARISRLLNPTPPRPFLGSPLPALLALALLTPLMANPRAEKPAPILRPAELVAQLDALAAKEGIDPHLLRAMAEVESQYDPKAVSRLGSTGLLQVMPATARKYGAQDLKDPAQVMAAGARYLKSLLTRYNGDWTKAVAAYNGGEEAIDAGKLSEETQRYVPAVLKLAQSKAVQADDGSLPQGLPLSEAKTTKPFGTSGSGSHDGIDLKGAEGTPVQATGGGIVTFAGPDGDRGLTVVVKHGQGLESLYSHLAEIRVKTGDTITRGTILGAVGHTGKATGPHLHYEVRKDGKVVDPKAQEAPTRPTPNLLQTLKSENQTPRPRMLHLARRDNRLTLNFDLSRTELAALLAENWNWLFTKDVEDHELNRNLPPLNSKGEVGLTVNLSNISPEDFLRVLGGQGYTPMPLSAAWLKQLPPGTASGKMQLLAGGEWDIRMQVIALGGYEVEFRSEGKPQPLARILAGEMKQKDVLRQLSLPRIRTEPISSKSVLVRVTEHGTGRYGETTVDLGHGSVEFRINLDKG